MAEFQFDTSGAVSRVSEGHGFPPRPITWSVLSPFGQGYTGAALKAAIPVWQAQTESDSRPGFSDLAPETLARIVEDCERAEPLSCFYLEEASSAGRTFWRWRQSGIMTDPAFPPLTLSLNDAGKVVFK